MHLVRPWTTSRTKPSRGSQSVDIAQLASRKTPRSSNAVTVRTIRCLPAREMWNRSWPQARRSRSRHPMRPRMEGASPKRRPHRLSPRGDLRSGAASGHATRGKRAQRRPAQTVVIRRALQRVLRPPDPMCALHLSAWRCDATALPRAPPTGPVHACFVASRRFPYDGRAPHQENFPRHVQGMQEIVVSVHNLERFAFQPDGRQSLDCHRCPMRRRSSSPPGKSRLAARASADADGGGAREARLTCAWCASMASNRN